MKDAISEVLETMFFVIVEFEGDASTYKPCCCQSTISIRSEDEKQTNIIFRAVEDFARTLTANFLGKTEDEVFPEDLEDTIKELTNMLGGSYVSRSTGRQWRLGIPHFEKPDGHAVQEEALGIPLFWFGEFVGEIVLQPSSLD
jgi:hypothetical protein